MFEGGGDREVSPMGRDTGLALGKTGLYRRHQGARWGVALNGRSPLSPDVDASEGTSGLREISR